MISNRFYLGDGRGVLISTEGGKKKNRLPVREQLPSSHCISLICSAREFSTSMGYFFKRLPP
jgi:hypothetical protein